LWALSLVVNSATVGVQGDGWTLIVEEELLRRIHVVKNLGNTK